MLAVPAALGGLAWRAALGGWLVTLALFGFSLGDWLSLALLPRMGRSFGPVRPPLLALAALRAVLSAAIGWLTPRPVAVLLVQSGLTLLSLYATWIEPFRLGVTHQSLTSPRLDPSLPPIRLLHLGDLHVEYVTRREVALQALVDELAPDLIVFTGDFVNLSYQNDPRTLKDIRRIVGQWRAPLGVYGVSGTPLVETPDDVARFVGGTGLRWLRNEVVSLNAGGQRVDVLGVDGALWREEAVPRLQEAARGLPDGDSFKLLLYHTPDVAPEASRIGFDLFVCGHTHGGQLRLPFYGAIVTASQFGKRFEMGRYQDGDMTLYVTRGLGVEGGSAPRARFLCPPEVILWTLHGKAD